jgi:hypothetical protein
MKKTLFTLAMLSSLYASAQNKSKVWEKTYDYCLGGVSMIKSVVSLPDGYLLAGYSQGCPIPTSNKVQGWVVKIDKQGGEQWAKMYGGSMYDGFDKIIKLKDGTGYMLAGTSNGDYWLVKIDNSGNVIWSNNYGGTKGDFATDMAETDNGEFIVTGITQSNDGDVTNMKGISDAWVIKIDAAGNLLWQKALGSSIEDNLSKITKTADNNYILCGTGGIGNNDVPKMHGSSDAWLVKMDDKGNILWNKTYGGTSSDYGVSITATKDGGAIFAGATESTDKDATGSLIGKIDAWVVKLNSAGNIEWQSKYGTKDDDYGGPIVETADGYLLANGMEGDYAVQLVKMDAAGKIQGEDKIQTIGINLIAEDLNALADNEFLLAGTWKNTSTKAGWIVSIDGDKLTNNSPNKIASIHTSNISIYPTVTNGIVNIELSAKSKAWFQLADMLGKVIPIAAEKNNDKYTINMSGLANGMYILQVRDGEQVSNHKIIYKK